MTWRNRAACLGEDLELFFPIGNTYPALLQMEEAKVVCRRCEVVETCLKWASESGQDSGVWGGLSADERHSLKRRNARARRASRVTPSLGRNWCRPTPSPGPKARPGSGSEPHPYQHEVWVSAGAVRVLTGDTADQLPNEVR